MSLLFIKWITKKTPNIGIKVKYEGCRVELLKKIKEQGICKFENFAKLRTSVYPSKSRPFTTKICENAFQTIPNVSFFDAEKNLLAKNFGPKK